MGKRSARLRCLIGPHDSRGSRLWVTNVFDVLALVWISHSCKSGGGRDILGVAQPWTLAFSLAPCVQVQIINVLVEHTSRLKSSGQHA